MRSGSNSRSYFLFKKHIDKIMLIKYTLNVKIFTFQNFDISKQFIKTSKKQIKKEILAMLEKIQEIVAEQLSCDVAEVTETTNFKEDLNADSLDLFELVMALEEEYNIEIPSEDLAQLNTVADVMNYLAAKGVN